MNANVLQTNLTEALNDKYQARALYRKVIQTFGPVRPFVNIIVAEQRHIEALLPLFERYGIPVPPDHWQEQMKPPTSLLEACRLGVEAELANAALYDRLLASTLSPAVRAVFLQLQAASRERHLPAFQRCVAREERVSSGSAGGRRCGRGQGRRHGYRGLHGGCVARGQDFRQVLWKLVLVQQRPDDPLGFRRFGTGV